MNPARVRSGRRPKRQVSPSGVNPTRAIPKISNPERSSPARASLRIQVIQTSPNLEDSDIKGRESEYPTLGQNSINHFHWHEWIYTWYKPRQIG